MITTAWRQRQIDADLAGLRITGVATGPNPAGGSIPLWVGGSASPAIRFGTAWHPINPGRAWLQHSGLPALRRESQRAGASMPGIVPRIKFRPVAAPVADPDRPLGVGTITQITQDIRFLAGQFVTTNLDTLATALYVRTDDLLKESPQLAPCRPDVGIDPKLSDAELVTLAVMQALLGFTSEARWLRHARAHLRHLFPYLPQQPGYNKRLRAAASMIRHCIRILAADTSVWTDDVWVVDSTPVECGRSRETAKRSDLAGWAEYGYCASHSRYFWGLRLHLVATLQGLPAAALAGAKADEREVLAGMLTAGPDLLAARPGQTLIGDKNYHGAGFEASIAEAGIRLLRPARKGESARAGAHLFKPLRQIIESVNDTFKGQLDVERHGGHTPAGVMVRVLQRILALTAAIWHNDTTGQPVLRSLVAYDGIDRLRADLIILDPNPDTPRPRDHASERTDLLAVRAALTTNA